MFFKKLIILFLTLFSFGLSANDGYLKIVAEEIVNSFQTGVDHYNQTKTKDLPEIKYDKQINYYFKLGQHLVEFSVAGYLQGIISVDKKDKKINSLKKPIKTVHFFQFMINSAMAEEGDINVEDSRILLAALGSLDKSLEEVTYLCAVKDYILIQGLTTCAPDTAKKNILKLKEAIRKRKDACENTDGAIAEGSNQSTVMNDVVIKDFTLVKELIKQISDLRAQKKEVKDFFKNYMSNTETDMHNCIDVMTFGTIADSTKYAMKAKTSNTPAKGYSQLFNAKDKSREANQLMGYSSPSDETLAAEKTCEDIKELRECLLKVKSTYNNNEQRNSKKPQPLPAIGGEQPGGQSIGK